MGVCINNCNNKQHMYFILVVQCTLEVKGFLLIHAEAYAFNIIFISFCQSAVFIAILV